MSFLKEVLESVTGVGQSSSYPPSSERGYPPQVPPPWIARWDSREECWIYINEESGERTFDPPRHSGGGYGGYGGGGAGYADEGRMYEGDGERRGHGWAGAGVGAAAGVAGGMILAHEGEKIEDRYEEDKYRFENDINNGVQDVEDFPDDAARWAGRKVQDVEDIPQDIENDYDRAKYGLENKIDDGIQDVEDIPQDIGNGIDDAAGWVGDKVGDVERFDDGIDNAFDQGRAEGRNDDRW